jgi:hypothetical protein
MKRVIGDAWHGWTKDLSSNMSGLKDGTQKQSTKN